MQTTAPAKIKTILAPTDFLPGSVAGVIEAATVAGAFGATLIVMTAIPRHQTHDHKPYLDQKIETTRLRLAAWFLHHVPASLRAGLSVRYLIVVDEPAHAIRWAATEEDVDLIVMAEESASTLGRLFHRSTTEAVLRGLVRPVLIVPAARTPVRGAAAA